MTGSSQGGGAGGQVEGRPVPAPRAPPRQALRAVYEQLLAVEQQRLSVAVRIEHERSIVFPETSVIVRDVRYLAEKLYGGAEEAGQGGVSAGSPPGEPPTAPSKASAEPFDGDAFDAAGEVDALLGELGQVEGLDGGRS